MKPAIDDNRRYSMEPATLAACAKCTCRDCARAEDFVFDHCSRCIACSENATECGGASVLLGPCTSRRTRKPKGVITVAETAAQTEQVKTTRAQAAPSISERTISHDYMLHRANEIAQAIEAIEDPLRVLCETLSWCKGMPTEFEDEHITAMRHCRTHLELAIRELNTATNIALWAAAPRQPLS